MKKFLVTFWCDSVYDASTLKACVNDVLHEYDRAFRPNIIPQNLDVVQQDEADDEIDERLWEPDEPTVTGVDNGPLVEEPELPLKLDGPMRSIPLREDDRRDISVTESQAARTRVADELARRQNPQNPRNQ